MLRNYIKIAYKVFLRRKFFTFISLFAISFTLMVLMVATCVPRSHLRTAGARNESTGRSASFQLFVRGEQQPRPTDLPATASWTAMPQPPNVEKDSLFTEPGIGVLL